MYAVEFRAVIKDNTIDIPQNLQDLNGQNVRIIILKDNIESVDDKEQAYYENLINNMSQEDKEISSKETFVL